MKLKTRERDGVVVLEAAGDMRGGPENMVLVDEVTRLAEENHLQLVIHCGKVRWISSTGLGILITARNRYAHSGGVLRLCDLNKRVLDIITITRLHLVLPIHETEEEAIAAFRG